MTQHTTSRPPQTVAKQVGRHEPSNIAASVVLLVLTLGAYLIGAVFDVIAAFAGASWVNPAALIGGGAILALLALVGAAVTVLLIARRRRAWPVALATLLVVLLGWIAVFVLFAFALA
ncbi:MAG TPA: hypothetical protein VGM38_06760 [Pseudolysinimonas sp.]